MAAPGIGAMIDARIDWASEDGELHTAVVQLPRAGTVLHAAVESMDETGWDWHVWDPDGHGQQYGLADTLEEARFRAERAMEALARQLRPTVRKAEAA